MFARNNASGGRVPPISTARVHPESIQSRLAHPEYLTTNIDAVGRSSKEFEMLIDAPEKGQPELVDVTVK